MIHIFELTPNPTTSDKDNYNPARDICRKLPKCDPGTKWDKPNWEKEQLQVQWQYGKYYQMAEAVGENVELWNKIYKAIEKRVNADMDDPQDIAVYCTALTGRTSLLACVVEARNAWLQSLVEQGVSQDTLDLACKYSRVWIPIWEQKPLKDGPLSRKGKTYTLSFCRWTEI